jgi:hypothetical protein
MDPAKPGSQDGPAQLGFWVAHRFSLSLFLSLFLSLLLSLSLSREHGRQQRGLAKGARLSKSRNFSLVSLVIWSSASSSVAETAALAASGGGCGVRREAIIAFRRPICLPPLRS